MTPELRDLLTALVADVRQLAKLVETLAGLEGHDQTAEKARSIGDDTRDLWTLI